MYGWLIDTNKSKSKSKKIYMFRKVEGNQDHLHVKDHLINWLLAPVTDVCSLDNSVSFTTALGKQFKSLTVNLFIKLQFITYKISFKYFLYLLLLILVFLTGLPDSLKLWD